MDMKKTVERVIELSRSVKEYWDRELPKRHPNYPWVNPGEDSGPPPPEAKELETLLFQLSPEEVFRLILVRNLGRRDFDTENLLDQYDQIKEYIGNPVRAVYQMVRNPTLPDDLEDGMSRLTKAGIDVSQLFAEHAK